MFFAMKLHPVTMTIIAATDIQVKILIIGLSFPGNPAILLKNLIVRYLSVVYTSDESYFLLNTKGAPDGSTQTYAIDTDSTKGSIS